MRRDVRGDGKDDGGTGLDDLARVRVHEAVGLARVGAKGWRYLGRWHRRVEYAVHQQAHVVGPHERHCPRWCPVPIRGVSTHAAYPWCG
jgi:hypothetical protein